MAQRVVGAVRDRGVGRTPEEAQAQRGDPLLTDRHGHHPPPVGQLEQHPAALVEGEVAAQVVALAHQPRHPDVGGVALLVRLGDQHDVTGRAPAAARQDSDRNGARRELALHVRGAAPDQPAVAELRRERSNGPIGARRGDDVGVGEQHQRRRLAATLEAGDEVEALRVGPNELAIDARGAEVVGEKLGGGGLVTGRVRGVEPDQRLSQPDHLVPEPGVGHRSRRSWAPASRRTASVGKASCIVPSRRSAGRAATRQL